MLLSLLLISCSSPIRDDRLMMGTSCSLTVFRRGDEQYIGECFDILSQIEDRISAKRSESEIGRINAAAGEHAVKVSRETFLLVERALEIRDLTEGAFDPLVGRLTALWNIGNGDEKVPSPEEISLLVAAMKRAEVVLDEKNSTVFITERDAALDLGAIGKGYSSDVLAAYLSESGVRKAIINLGGNVYAVGSKGRGKLWNVGLRSPEGDGIFTTVSVEEGAVVTSGAYERYFISDGVMYHHILDPESGYPVDLDLVSVSILSRDGTLADALSTAVFVLGRERGTALLKRLDVRAVLLTKEGEIIRL